MPYVGCDLPLGSVRSRLRGCDLPLGSVGSSLRGCNLPLGSVGSSLRGCDLPLLVGDHGHYEAVVAVEAVHQIHVCVSQREVEHLPRKQLQATNT